jgi:hypothetical protein
MTHKRTFAAYNFNMVNEGDALTGSAEQQYFLSSIASLRMKLLNLTKRNPLVKFRHSDRSRRFVRIIDELPVAVYERLAKGDSLKIESVGSQDHAGNETESITFLRAFEAAKSTDADFVRQTGELGEDAGERVYERLVEELRERVRSRLGMSPRKKRLSAEDAARRLGRSPDFELPRGGGPRSKPHDDKALQTLLFDDQLDATLNNMRDVMRLSIEEKGVTDSCKYF